MKIILGARGCGKTNEAINIANNKNAYLVVRCQKEAHRCFGSLKNYPITYEELLRTGMRGAHPSARVIVIDDALEMLRYIFSGINIKAITIAGHILEDAAFSSIDDATRPAPEIYKLYHFEEMGGGA